MRFTVYFSKAGVPQTGLSPIVSVHQITNAATPVVSNPITWVSATPVTGNIGEGFYFYDYADADVDYDYTANFDGDPAQTVVLTGSERYAPCISTVQGDVELIRAIEAGRWKIDIVSDPNQMIFYNEAGSEIKAFDLTQGTVPQYTERTPE